MKKILTMAIIFVLSLGATALAATTWTTEGYVEYGFGNAGSEVAEWFGDWRLDVTGNIDGKSGFQIRFIPVPDEEGAYDGYSTLYNLWTETPVGKLVVGVQTENMTELNIFERASFMNTDTTIGSVYGAGLYTAISYNGKAYLFYDGELKAFGGQAKFTEDQLTVYGGMTKEEGFDPVMAFGASYELVKDAVKVYGEYNRASGNYRVFAGAKATAAGFDLYGEYAFDTFFDENILGFKVAKTINSVEWYYEMFIPEHEDVETRVAAKLKF